MYKSNYSTLGKIAAIVLAALAIILALSWIGNKSDGFKEMNPTKWEYVARNEKNLIKVENIAKPEYDEGMGFSVTVDDYGVVRIDGTNMSETAAEVKLGKVTLPKGTYTCTTGKDGKGDTNRFSANIYGRALVSGVPAGDPFYADFGGVLTLSEDTEIELCISIPAGAKFTGGYKLYPAIVPGTEAVSFFGK